MSCLTTYLKVVSECLKLILLKGEGGGEVLVIRSNLEMCFMILNIFRYPLQINILYNNYPSSRTPRQKPGIAGATKLFMPATYLRARPIDGRAGDEQDTRYARYVCLL